MLPQQPTPVPGLTPAPWFDTHAHLEMEVYDGDREAVLERARQAGLAGVIGVGVDAESSRRAVSLADAGRRLWATVGVHPHEAGRVGPAEWAELRSLVRDPRVVALGEMGLDYHYEHSPRALQQEVFRRQLEWAVEIRLPVVIHDREAHDDLLALLREFAPLPAGGVIHCFSGDVALMREVVALGFHVALGGIVTFRNAEATREVAREVPLERLLLETDSPYLTPHPHRGRRNEPAQVAWVGHRIAELRGLPTEELARRTTENARRLFRLDEAP